MSRIPLTCFLTTLLAAATAFGQNAAQPANSKPTQPQAATQDRADASAAETARPGSSAKPGSPRQGPISGNQVQVPSPNKQTRGRRSENAAHPETETRAGARYAHPSGQDSQPDHSPRKTELAAPGSKKDRESGVDRTPEATGQSKQAARLAKGKTYTGVSGSKANPGTACSTARPTVNGGIDCGMSGNSATQGKIVTKPR